MAFHVDKTVRQETAFIGVCVLGLTAVMELVFLLLGHWDLTVLYGGLYGAFVAVFNFFLMGLTVQRAVERDPKNAQNLVKASSSARLLMQLVFCAVAAMLPGAFNLLAVILPLLFPRIGVMLRQLQGKKQ